MEKLLDAHFKKESANAAMVVDADQSGDKKMWLRQTLGCLQEPSLEAFVFSGGDW